MFPKWVHEKLEVEKASHLFKMRRDEAPASAEATAGKPASSKAKGAKPGHRRGVFEISE